MSPEERMKIDKNVVFGITLLLCGTVIVKCCCWPVIENLLHEFEMLKYEEQYKGVPVLPPLE